MLPEQRGLLASWFSQLRYKRSDGNKARRHARRGGQFARSYGVESLEDRRMLTNTVYVDFGTLLSTTTMQENAVGSSGGWNTFGYSPTNNGQNWVFGPNFNIAGNPQITYTPLATLFDQKADTAEGEQQGILNPVSFNLGQVPSDFPGHYQTGTTTPLSQLDLLENSIMDIITQMYLPFNVTVREVTSTGFGGPGSTTSPPTTPAGFLGQNNPLYDPNTYNPANPPTDPAALAMLRGPAFNGMQLNTATGAPDQYQDVYILVGGWTLADGTQIGNSAAHQIIQPDTAANPNAAFEDPGTPGILGIFGATSNTGTPPEYANPGALFPDPTYMDSSEPGGELLYSDGGVAICADTIMDDWRIGQLELSNAVPIPTADQQPQINLDVAMAQTAADLAAQTWGLLPTADGLAKPWNPFFDTNVDTLSSSDVMRQGPYTADENPTDLNMPFFENFSLMLGDSNESYAEVQNAYQQFINDPDIGPGHYGYITGTGAYDKIVIAADPTHANLADVTVSPYSDASFDDASFISTFAVDASHPGGYFTSVADPYSYTVDLSTFFTIDTTTGKRIGELLIDAGNNADQISIDPTLFSNFINANPKFELMQVFLLGGEGLSDGVDNFTMTSDGTQSATVAPFSTAPQTYNFAASYGGDIEIPTVVGVNTVQTVIELDEFDSSSIVHLQNFSSLTYSLPQFLDDNVTMTGQNGSNLVVPPNPGGTDMTIGGMAGPVGSQVALFNVEFTVIPKVVVENLGGATADSITVNSTAGYADGLQDLEFDLGPGNDSLTFDGPIDLVPNTTGGTIVYDGGTGNDTLNVSQDTDWTLTDAGVTDGLGNSIQFLNDSVENVNLSATDDPTFSVEDFSGNATLTGSATGGDTFNIGDTAAVSGNVTIDGSAGFLGDTFNIDDFSGVGNFTGTSGDDTFNINTNTITLSSAATGSGTSTAYVGTAAFNLSTTSGSTTAKVASTAGLVAGEAVVGPGVTAGTTISAILNLTNIKLSTGAIATGTNMSLIGVIGSSIKQTTLTTTAGKKTADEGGSTILSAGETVVGDSNIGNNTTIAGISNITIAGGAGNDTFYVKSWNGVGNLDGGDGNDNFVFGTLSTTSPSGDGKIDAITQQHTITGDAGNDTVTLDDSGNTNAEDYTVGATSVTDTSTFGGLIFDSTLENLILIGSQGANTFTVTPNVKTAITIDGQLPSTNPGDELDVDLTGTKGAKLTPNGPSGGTLSFTSGQKSITYSNIEKTVPDLTQVAQQQQQQAQANQLAGLILKMQTDPLLVGAADTGTGSAPLVKLYDAKTNTVMFSFSAYETGFKGGVRATVVPDITGDGVPDIIVAPGSGRLGEVKIYSGAMLAAGASTGGTHLVANPDLALVSGGNALVVNTTAGSSIVTVGLMGQAVTSLTGANIAFGTTVSSINSSTSIILSQAATGTGTVTATIGLALVTLKTTVGKTTATVASIISVNGMIVGQSVAGSNQISVTTTQGSKMLVVATTVGLGVTVGEPVTGLNIPGGAAVTGIGAATSLAMTTTAGSTNVTVGNTAGLAVGASVVGANIPAGTTISAIVDGANLTLSNAATGSGTHPAAIGANTITISAAAIGPDPTMMASQTVTANFDPVASNTTISSFKLAGTGISITLSTKLNITSTGTNALVAAGFLPEASTYKSGLYVAAGDLNGDGSIQLVTSRSTGVPNVEVFNVTDLMFGTDTPIAVFNPYTSKFTTGAQIAVGDVDGDGAADIVTVPGSGQTAQVEVFNFASVEGDLSNSLPVTPARSFLGFESSFKNGVSLTVGDFDGATFNGNPIDEIALGAGTNGTSRVHVFDEFGTMMAPEFKAFTTSTNSPLRIAAVTDPTSGQAILFATQANVAKSHVIEGFEFNDVPGAPFDSLDSLTLNESFVDSFVETDPSMSDGVFLG